MPGKSSVDAALALIKEDPSKILRLKYGSHDVMPGDILPRAGRSPVAAALLLLNPNQMPKPSRSSSTAARQVPI
jgi:hypothetical protein